ncbi:MAG: hypothetical protein QM680_14385 [Luteolibacter sp.]
MKTSLSSRHPRGYISLMTVICTLTLLLMLMLYAYKRSLASMNTQKQVQLKVDYNEKEEAMLRYLVANVPNRAIRAMQDGSTASTDLTWEALFTESITAGNARQSIAPALVTATGAASARLANTGDSALATHVASIFTAVNDEVGLVSTGLNRSLGSGYPVALNCTDAVTNARDLLYPIISSNKKYGALASGAVGRSTDETDGYQNVNVLTYPRINFGYGTPGADFVAKRNWWAFNIDLAANDAATTSLKTAPRQFVLSVYEVPSQLAISSAAAMALGQYSSGSDWENVTVSGNVFAGKADVAANMALDGLASRRLSTLAAGSTIGGQALTGNVFTPGVREAYQLTTGDFFPVSQASESGKVAFVPITREADFFDAYSQDVTCWDGSSDTAINVASNETNTVATQTWNNYSIGALQTAMRLDLVECAGIGGAPTRFQFQYLNTSGNPQSVLLLAKNIGFIEIWNNSDSDGKYYIKMYPERIPEFLASLGDAAGVSINNSIAVNVNYKNKLLGTNYPQAAPSDLDTYPYRVAIGEADDLTPFTKGFSLVTNLRLYIADDFNATSMDPPTGYGGTTPYYPPCSLFAPEKRYGLSTDPISVELTGQVGSVANDADDAVHPLDSKGGETETAISSSKLTVNLHAISDPADLPPITMMNWLILLEEKTNQF